MNFDMKKYIILEYFFPYRQCNLIYFAGIYVEYLR